MNRQIRLVGVAILILFTALVVQLSYWQLARANALNNNPDNHRNVIQTYVRPRGDIVTADGVTLARSVPSHDQYKYLRQYPQGSLFSDLTGYYSLTNGITGAEKSYNDILSGKKREFSLGSLSVIRHELLSPNQTQNVTLTVSAKLQRIAAQQLGNRDGAVVALDPKTGAILAMYSNPSYDPNLLAGHDEKTVTDNYNELLHTPGNPLLPAAYAERFFPGSSFKIITASAVYDRDPTLASKTYPVLSGLKLPDTTHVLSNFAGEYCGGQLPLLFQVSCNSGFGQVGLDLGASKLADEANAFGFNKTPPLDLPGVIPAYFPPAASFAGNLPGVAFSAIGQENVAATPLEMALVASAIADHGTIMTPHVLSEVTNSQGQVVARYRPKPWLHATSRSTASTMTGLMERVVNQGTGVAAQIPGVQVAGKTGTAQTGHNTIHAWFAAFAPAKDPTIAVAVLVENQPNGNAFQGGTIAAPIAKAVIEAALLGPAAPTTSYHTGRSKASGKLASPSTVVSPTASGVRTRPLTSMSNANTSAKSVSMREPTSRAGRSVRGQLAAGHRGRSPGHRL